MAENISAFIVCNHHFSKCFICGSIGDCPTYHFVQRAKLLEIPSLIFCNQNDIEGQKPIQQRWGNYLVFLSSLYWSIWQSMIRGQVSGLEWRCYRICIFPVLYHYLSTWSVTNHNVLCTNSKKGIFFWVMETQFSEVPKSYHSLPIRGYTSVNQGSM